ncbi:MAG TPA: DUF2924 domain-containing protein [Acetobacteraceae bacterium]|nr:DUF2924 domain-containing protein [Acetobacteraceae bacterium]
MTPIDKELARLAGLSGRDLRAEWRRRFRREPPPDLSRDLLLRAITYKAQEAAHRGLSQTARKALSDLGGRIIEEGIRANLSVAPVIAPGVRLVRDWGGRAHSVLVLEKGFEYAGERVRSLTEIARRITGAHLSGPRFFGLTPGQAKARSSGSSDACRVGVDGPDLASS